MGIFKLQDFWKEFNEGLYENGLENCMPIIQMRLKGKFEIVPRDIPREKVENGRNRENFNN